MMAGVYPALAAEVSGETGVLASAQAATGASANFLRVVNGPVSLFADYTIAAGTATIQIEQRAHAAASFRAVTGSSQSASVTLKIDDPAGDYQANVTACGSCNVTVRYRLVFQRSRF